MTVSPDAPSVFCGDTRMHLPHFHREDEADPYSICPGSDAEPLAPERDRDQTELPDWTPEYLYLSDVAAFVMLAHRNTTGREQSVTARAQYITVMEVWKILTGLNEPEGLIYAASIATLNPPTTAVVPPF